MSNSIRLIEKKDYSSVLHLVQGFSESAEFYWPQAHLQDELENSKGLGFWQEQKLLAFLLWRELPEAQEISVLATAPGSRRLGLMDQLLKRAFAAYSQRPIWWLEVHEQNLSARKLYTKLGFIESGRRPHYYRDGGNALSLSYHVKTT